MPRNGYQSPGLVHFCDGLRRVALACCPCVLILVSCVNGAAQSSQVVMSHQKAFYEAWLNRSLRGNELREITDEFITLYTKRGKDRAGMHEVARRFEHSAKLLREQKGAPGEINYRHDLLEANYFDPSMQGTTELRLLTEPDPVCIIDPGGKRLMTHREVVALANLAFFSASNEEPRHREFSRREIDKLVGELDRQFGNHPGAANLPRFCREAAALWAGIQRQWPNLNSEQKRQVKAYADKGELAPMNDLKLYRKLLDLNAMDAFSHWNEDHTARQLNVLAQYYTAMNVIKVISSVN